MEIIISHRFSAKVLFTVQADNLKLALLELLKSGANLSGADLSGADLSRADLSDANLSRADLSDAFIKIGNIFRTIART